MKKPWQTFMEIFLLSSFHGGVLFPLALVWRYLRKHCAVYVS